MLTDQVVQMIGTAVDLSEVDQVIALLDVDFELADALRVAAAHAAMAAAEAGFVAGWQCHADPARLVFRGE